MNPYQRRHNMCIMCFILLLTIIIIVAVVIVIVVIVVMYTYILQEVADPSDIEIFYKDICNETTRLQELSDENIRLRTQIHELQKPSEVDGKGKSRKTSEHVIRKNVHVHVHVHVL